MSLQQKFKLKVMNPDGIIYEGEVASLFIQGDTGEFEILAFHYPVMGLIKQGKLLIDWKKFLNIKSGILKFFENDCVILAEV